ncbi:ABC transporter permease [Mediterraneibacter glycyrrhizinilyticus]|uniref:ABC transporter permease n=1 Tax=Mediterraneibacter glycyrrhizinilyticus TaxID=342942 RepID=UPI00189E259E|nr:ABC transporter permease [Mediterraneibacter glycyrrhizinilyticus]
MKKHVSMVRFSEHISDILSYGGLVLCIVVFSILSQGRLFNAYNIKILVQAVCVYAIMAMGAIFIYSMGYMDISVGSQVGVYCILCIVVTNKTGSLLAGFLTILALSLICGLINGYVAVMLGLPSIVTSIFLMSIFGGAQLLIMEKLAINSISIEYDMTFFKSTEFMIFVIVVIALISIYLYNYTQLGEYVKSIGANELATSYSGVKTVKWKVLAYVFFGICVAVGAFMLTARTGSAGQGTGTGYAMDIMVALLLGGMPLSGGMKSKMSSSLIGSFTYVILSNGLNLAGVKVEYSYVIKAVVFLAVILVTCRKKDGVLPR